MINSTNELYKILESSMDISAEVVKTLMDLDTLPSTTTQAFLNDRLVTLYNRIGNITIQNNKMSKTQFIEWIKDNFTEYSYNMLVDTLKLKEK